ncbi:MAG: hypothetical protein KatS3mg110_3231 [Pirellulaceae bacterium]|nr:MAG: hypothetical protein KatS3mg110_3231 [Pirellulaceae bacterium]
MLGVNRKRIQRLVRRMGLEAVYPKPRTTQRRVEHRSYPYLLRDLQVERPNQVWSSDITYVPICGGFMYLTVVVDCYSRYVLSWRLLNTLDGLFCLEALKEASEQGVPEILNSDQDRQYTVAAYTGRLEKAGVAISMDGRGRATDNAFVERLWRMVKYEDIYLKEYGSVADGEVRGYLPEGVWERSGVACGPGWVLSVLQLRATAYGTWLLHAGRGVWGGVSRDLHGKGTREKTRAPRRLTWGTPYGDGKRNSAPAAARDLGNGSRGPLALAKNPLAVVQRMGYTSVFHLPPVRAFDYLSQTVGNRFGERARHLLCCG